MSYNIKSADYIYKGKKWKLSRSKIDLFLECPRCFYLDNKLGIARPPSFPFNLNSAVDSLLKKEFDLYREKAEPHPLILKYNIDAIPFKHKDLNLWRDNFHGLSVYDDKLNFIISGAVDDLWVNKKGEIIVVDYKSTSKKDKIDKLDADWQVVYKRQVEVYQWLLRRLGFKVSDTAYFVYANANTKQDIFDARLIFDVSLIAYEGSCAWVDTTLRQIKRVLEDSRVPLASKTCKFCEYIKRAGRALQSRAKK